MASNGEKKEQQSSATVNYGNQTSTNSDGQNITNNENNNHNGIIVGCGEIQSGQQITQSMNISAITSSSSITTTTTTILPTAAAAVATSSSDYSGNECVIGGNLTPINTIKFPINQIDFQNIKAASDTLKVFLLFFCFVFDLLIDFFINFSGIQKLNSVEMIY